MYIELEGEGANYGLRRLRKEREREGRKKEKGRWTHRNTQLFKNGTEPLHLPSHFLPALFPKAIFFRLLESDCYGFLEGAYAAEADPGVSCGDVVDEVRGTDEEADAPAGGVDVFACGADGEGS